MIIALTLSVIAVAGWLACGWLAWRYRSVIGRNVPGPGVTKDTRQPEPVAPAGQDFSAVESIGDYGIAILDTGGLLKCWNAGAERMTGYSHEEVAGKHYSMLYTAPEEDAAPVSERLRLAAELGRFEFEGFRVRKDGSEFRANCVTAPVKDAAGKLCGFCEITRELAHGSGDREQLEAAIERAEAANRAKSEFLAVVSHEIRTPMNVILGMADLLHASPLDAQQRQFVDVFRRAGNSLLGLLNDVLDLSKIESGRLDLEQAEFDLVEAARQALELIAQRARSKGIVLDSGLPPGPVKLLGDSARLRQILLNLLGNAIKFTEAGSVTLSIAPHSSGDAGHFEFRVEDTGIGIAAVMLPAIFEDFTQADSSFARKYGGTGLGLGISRRLVRLMGGELTAKSELGKGSVFQFDARFQPAPCVPLPADSDDLQGVRAALVGYDPALLSDIEEMLRPWGLKCRRFCSNGDLDRALLDSASNRPEIAILAGTGVRGFESARVPLILLDRNQEAPNEARANGVQLAGYAVTPVRPSELRRLIQAALESRPTAPPEAEQAKAEAPAAVTPAVIDANRAAETAPERPRILIAEDSEDNRLLMELYLKGSGYAFEMAEDGKEAVDLFPSRHFDLVLMDLQMPVMDGLAATQCIRTFESESGREPTPILAFTASTRGADLRKSLVAGCNGFLTKPLSKARLMSALDRFGPSGHEIHHAGAAAGGEGLPAPEYLTARRKELEQLAILIEARESGQILAMAGHLKSAGAAYNFPHLATLGGKMEAAAKVSDFNTLDNLFVELADCLWSSAA